MGSKKAEKQKNTIRSKIFAGYTASIGIMLFLVVVSIILMQLVKAGYSRVNDTQLQRVAAQEVVSAHYKWLEQLSDSITTGSEFQGSLDPHSCALGKWLDSSESTIRSNAEMSQLLNEITEPHNQLHLTAQELIDVSKVNKDKAYDLYASDYKPKVETVGNGLTAISELYHQTAEQEEYVTKLIGLVSQILLAAAGVISVVICVVIGQRTAREISEPIVAVENWSDQLAAGVDNIDFDVLEEKDGKIFEIDNMIRSFKKMMISIQENVNVIKRVADGDLTAYVDIRSNEDSLGKNLYHLVQNNDFIFSQLLQVADSVATSANHIADNSQLLAKNSTEQAAAVEVLSSTVEQANILANKNAEESISASKEISEMEQVIEAGKSKMDTLLRAVDDIRQASEKVSDVMKSINDIAFQTNILALNAAVEAARAGALGKGFAVVADEVRRLSQKSKEAADESRVLIENTIQKTVEGSRISEETAQTFSEIVDDILRLSSVMDGINNASLDQQSYITEIHDEIAKISGAVAQNATYSEQAASATVEMNLNAEHIRNEMKQFNLRKREPGKPYIPPEKQDDADFIKEAAYNFEQAQKKTKAAATDKY